MFKPLHSALGSFPRYKLCRKPHTAASTTLGGSKSFSPPGPAREKVESQKSLQSTRIRRRLQSFLRGRLKYANFPSLDTERYLVFLEQCKKRRRPDQAYAVAANLLNRSNELGEEVWSGALLHYVLLNNSSAFKATIQSLIASGKNSYQVLRDQPALLPYAFRVSINDAGFLRALLLLSTSALKAEVHNGAGLYGKIVNSLVCLDRQEAGRTRLRGWHEDLLKSGFKPSLQQISDLVKILCNRENYKDSIEIESIFQQYKEHSIPYRYQDVLSEFYSQKRFDQLEHFFRLMLKEARGSLEISGIDDITAGLLDYCIKFSNTNHTESLIKLLLKSSSDLGRAVKLTLARFHGIHNKPKALVTVLQRDPSSTADLDDEQDIYWAAYLRGKRSTSTANVFTLVKELRRVQPVLGKESLQVLIEHAKSKSEAFELLHILLQKHSSINYRGYATCVRFIAKQGDVDKAWALMKACLASEMAGSTISDQDASFLKRNLILGLLEGQNIGELETRHLDMYLSGIATDDTWNLLLRARLSDRRLPDAIAGLQEMQIHGLDVENATAQEFMTTILRPRKPGSNPDVLSTTDIRPYLADIKMAISIGIRCLSLGGRTQPETWREVLKRLGMYGEFETLDKVSVWLISQYSKDRPEAGQPAKLFKMNEMEEHVPAGNPQQLLSRLIRNSDICATITRGFKTGKPAEALNLAVRWQSQGVYVSKDSVKKRLRIGLRYMAASPSTTSSDIRALREELAPIFAKLT